MQHLLPCRSGGDGGRREVRVAALEAKLREQGDAMAAMQRDVAEMRRAMALLKGIAAAGASAEKSEGEGAGQGSASGEAAEGIGAQLPKGARESIVVALEVEEVKVRLEAARGEARDAASEMRGEMGALKAELAQLKEAAERHAAEVADVKATAARINDLELALAALKDGRAEKSRADRSEGSAGEHAEAERHEGKRRKRDEACKEEEMADAAVGVGPPPFTDGGAVVEKRDEAEEDGEAKGRKNHGARDTKTDLQRLMALVEAVENASASGSKMWEIFRRKAAEPLIGNVTTIDFCPSAPFRFAATHSTRVRHSRPSHPLSAHRSAPPFAPLSLRALPLRRHHLHPRATCCFLNLDLCVCVGNTCNNSQPPCACDATNPMAGDGAFSGRFRADGKLLVAGGDRGIVQPGTGGCHGGGESGKHSGREGHRGSEGGCGAVAAVIWGAEGNGERPQVAVWDMLKGGATTTPLLSSQPVQQQHDRSGGGSAALTPVASVTSHLQPLGHLPLYVPGTHRKAVTCLHTFRFPAEDCLVEQRARAWRVRQVCAAATAE
ncbi:unnamed protein product [Closterium sp. Naga37s-1]|nr:unnamed protein product [Closterium sp. Naga37s-1]